MDVLYVHANSYVVRGCAGSSRYTNICNNDVFSIVNMYHDHLKLCVVCINGRRYVGCSGCYVVSDECHEPTPCPVRPIGAYGSEVKHFVSFCFMGEIGFLNCDYICMGVVNRQFELLEFVFNSVYVSLKYN